MTRSPQFFVRPEGAYREVGQPQLASWDRAGHDSQLRLAKWHAEAAVVLPELRAIDGPSALRLDVGLPEFTEPQLLADHDLDNYLTPLVATLVARTNIDLTTVWATKRPANTSMLRVAPAVACNRPSWAVAKALRTTATTATSAYKEQIRDQLRDLTELPPGPVKLQLAFAVGPGRQWINLWKPTIDALGQLLGVPEPSKPWAPNDGRIVELALHRTLDPDLGNDVVIEVILEVV